MTDSQSDSTRAGSDYRTGFLAMLQNQGKRSKGDKAARERGFVVLVRGGSNLKPIQSLCFDEKQTYNHCLTARYRLQPGAAIGTLVAAFIADLLTIDRKQKEIAGDLMPVVSYEASPDTTRGFGWTDMASVYLDRLEPTGLLLKLWPASPGYKTTGYFTDFPISHFERYVKGGVLDEAEVIKAEALNERQIPHLRRELEAAGIMSGSPALPAQGVLTQDELGLICKTLSDPSILGTGQRLVLLGEISDTATDVTEWQSAMNALFGHLPERVGIVLSGAPKDFVLPANDPHFLEITLPKEGSEPIDGKHEYAYRYTDSSFHKDEPARKDELGVNDFANAIARLLLHRQTQPPLTIGIHGPWGKGKSSFMRLVDSALVKFAEINRNDKRPELNGETRTQRWNDIVAKLLQLESRIQAGLASVTEVDEYQRDKQAESALWKTMVRDAHISVFFNAWQFEDAKQTWAGLASQISGEMEKAVPWYSRQRLKLRYAWKERKTELILNILMPMAVTGFVTALIILGFFNNIVPKDKVDTPLGTLLQYLLPASSGLFTVWLVSSQILKVAEPISTRVLSYVRLPNYRDQMGFQHRVRDDLQFVYQFVKKRRRDARVVVYIDDLDRCSENKIMETLQAINLILASCEFFVFVGMDTEMIYRAIKAYYKDNVPARFPENYLSKIVQISFYLPETDQSTRCGYLDTLFSATARLELLNQSKPAGGGETLEQVQTVASDELRFDFAGLLKIVPIQLKEAEDTAAELQTFRDYSGFLDDNPREIKRLINIHRLIKILVQKHDTSWPAEMQRKLVKWLIFCETWPDLVDDILDEKEYAQSLNCLGDLAGSLKANRGKSTSPYPSPEHLSEFAHFMKDQDALTGEDINEGFRLAAYLSQLVRKSSAVPGSVPQPAPTVAPPAGDEGAKGANALPQ